MNSMKENIEQKLNTAFAPSYLLVVNESAKHSGHSGDDGSGESHFSIKISADFFTGKGRVEQQRIIYAALSDEMKTIHALSIHVQS